MASESHAFANCSADLPADDATRLSDERQLVDAARRSPQAFGQLYLQHYQAIARYLLRRTGDRHVTEDLVADVFVSALRRLETFRWRGVTVRLWLYRMATNAANRWCARRRRDLLRSASSEPAAAVDRRDACETIDDASHLRQRLLRLAPRHQAVLALHYFEGLSIAEIASTLNCRPGTVQSRLARARDALRRELPDWED